MFAGIEGIKAKKFLQIQAHQALAALISGMHPDTGMAEAGMWG